MANCSFIPVGTSSTGNSRYDESVDPHHMKAFEIDPILLVDRRYTLCLLSSM